MYFKEEQRFAKSTAGKIASVAMIVAGLLPFGIVLLSEKDMSAKPEVWWILGGTALLIVLLVLVMMQSKLKVKITRDYLEYSYPPFVRRPKRVLWSEVESATVRKYSPMKEFGGYGYRKIPGANSVCLNVSGNIGLDLRLKNGHQLVLGTQKENAMRYTVNQIQEKLG